ncbi:MAG: hypothetical protein JSS66_06870 [Armatimonadetes bacterium]|nr:hypothetical protein [Armatimonadota bacterium]
MTAFISCDYDEGDDALATYRGYKVRVKLEDGTEESHLFMTGDPPADFRSACDYTGELYKLGKICYSGYSSSVDHFVMDCAGYFEWYLDENEQEFFRKSEETKEANT